MVQLVKFKPAIVIFFYNKIQLLSHEISIDGIKLTDKNIKAITEFTQPKTQKAVRSFLVMCSNYLKHVKDFAHNAHSLIELIKRAHKKIEWKEEYTNAFKTLKNSLRT